MKSPLFNVRRLEPGDFAAVVALGRRIYPDAVPWAPEQLVAHLRVFPEGQLVVVHAESGSVVGYAATLIVFWDDYELDTNWRDFTDHGYFTNHDPERGRTLYAADIMVDPDWQGRGVGKLLYAERRTLMARLGLLRIRAGARLQGYHRYHDIMSPGEYVREVVAGRLSDPTLSFQLQRGFKVIGVAANYMRHDPLSLGFAAVIEYLNPDLATPGDLERQRRSPYYG
jgi:ribosomal protein S18 acetylase RimI-like enzyme